MAKIVSKNTGDVPGTIKSHGSSSEPNGYLICDGRSLSQEEFKALFQSIGTSFGDGSTGTVFGTPGGLRFNLPDLRGRFLRGVDGTAGNDPDKAGRTAMAAGGATANNIGSVQNDNFKSHRHGYKRTWIGFSGGMWQPDNDTLSTGYDNANIIGENGGGQAMTNTGGNETRPKNAYVNYIIKY